MRFLRWLRSENAERRSDTRTGFYGLDLYSLHRSIARVIEYLEKVDPNAAKRARQGYACFDAFGEDVQIWHNKVRIDNPLLCEGDGPVYQNRQWYEQFYMDAASVPPELRARKVIEIDKGLANKPPLKHALE